MTHPKQKKRRKYVTRINVKYNQQKNNRKNRQNSKKSIATVAEHQTGQDNMNAQPEEGSVQNAEK